MGSIFSSTTKSEKEESVYLYHYTDIKGLIAIHGSGLIRSSTNIGQDARFGIGVYLTSMEPHKNKMEILVNNYDSDALTGKFDGRADFYFKFKSTDLQGITKAETERNVWLYPKDIRLAKCQCHCGKTNDSQTQSFKCTYDGYQNRSPSSEQFTVITTETKASTAQN